MPNSPSVPAVPRTVLVTMPLVIDETNGDDFGGQLATALASGPSTLIVDSTSTRSCDCSGLRMLFAAIAKAAEDGTSLRLVAPPLGAVQLALWNSGLNGLLPTYPSLRSACPPGPPPITTDPMRRPVGRPGP